MLKNIAVYATGVGSLCTSQCREPKAGHGHCAVCHRTMASVSVFDKHRHEGVCLDVAELGLVELDGLWATEERHAENKAVARRLAEGRRRTDG